MSQFSKVSWQDGMFLLPQHFQQADRYHDAARGFLQRTLHPLSWGVHALQLDEDALRQGTLALVLCRAILPDGTLVDAPTADALPPPRPIDLPANRRTLEVFLTVPALRAELPRCTQDAARADIRYHQGSLDISDDLDPELRQPIEIARKNLRLVVGDESQDGLVVLKLSEVQRDAAGALVPRPDFMPPALHLQATATLAALSREVIAAVGARASSLAAERRKKGFARQPTAEDQEEFLFLHTLNGHAPLLRHLAEQPGTHPASLHGELLRLAGVLASFDPRAREAIDLPSYNHQDPGGSLSALWRRLRLLLERSFGEQYIKIPLARVPPVWKGMITDREVLSRGVLYLETQGLPDAARDGFPEVCKIAEYNEIDRVMASIVREVTIGKSATPPDSVPRTEGAHYFTIERNSKGFDLIVKTGQIGVFVANARSLPQLQLSLIGLRPRSGS